MAFPLLPTDRLEFLPGTAITTAVWVVKDECEEKDLSKTWMFARTAQTRRDGNRRSRASDREDLPEAHPNLCSVVLQEQVRSLTRSNLALLFVSFPVYIT